MKKLTEFVLTKKGTLITAASGILTAVISLVMNLALIPEIEKTTNGIRCFDMNFGYSYETAKEFLSLIGENGKSVYLNAQLPLDFVYPVAYTVFFVFIIIKLTQNARGILAFPLLLAAFDYAENICNIVMLKSAELSKTVAALGSAFTSIKTILMYSVFIEIIICFVFFIKNKKATA